MQGVAPPPPARARGGDPPVGRDLLASPQGPSWWARSTDALRATFGNEAVRYSLLLVSLVGIVSAACYLAGARSVGRDLRAAQGAAPAAS